MKKQKQSGSCKITSSLFYLLFTFVSIVDSVDWKQSGADVEYNRVMKNVKEGSILLFHNNAKYTPENLDRIINKLTDEGYKFLTVSELIYDDNYYIDENGVQNKK